MTGRVQRVSVKPKTPGEHGLPKSAVPRLEVTEAGAVGDYNKYRATHMPDDRDQALLLLTDEVLAQLQSEGWPVQPGDLGENVTLQSIPEASLGPGARLRLGEVLVEITLACDPCSELYVLPYVGSGKGPEFVRTLKGRRGWYARVLEPGAIERGSGAELVSPVARS